MGKLEQPAENVAVFGVTGALGREIQTALEVDQDVIGRFIPVAGTASAGASVTWRGTSQPVVAPASVDPSTVDIAALACPAAAARREAVRLVKAGVRVIDASGGLARSPAPAGLSAPAPLVWPGLANHSDPDVGPVALPGDIASTLAPVLEALTTAAAAPLHLLPPLASVDAVILRSAVSAGRHGVHALSTQTVSLLNYQPVLDPAPFPATLAFSVVAPADEEALLDEARATEELRALVPALGSIPLNLSGLIVPVFSGLAAVVTVRFMGAQTVSLEHARAALFAHPDLAPADAVDLGADDDEGDDEGDDSRSPARTDPRPEGAADDGDPDVGGAASLRDAVDSDAVRVQTPRVTPDGSLRLVVMADPLHRTAAACESIIAGWLADARD